MKYSYPIWLKIAFVCVFVLGFLMKSPVSIICIVLIFISLSGSYVKIENEKLYIRKNIFSFFEINLSNITETKEEDNKLIIQIAEKKYKIIRYNLSSKDYEEIKNIVINNRKVENSMDELSEVKNV